MRLGDVDTSILGRWVALAVAFVGLISLAYVVLRPFLIPLAWAGILVYVTWPLHQALRSGLQERAGLAALLMTAALALLFILPTLWLILSLAREAPLAFERINAYVTSGEHSVPELLGGIPVVGELLQRQWEQLIRSTPAFGQQVLQWAGQWSGYVTGILGGVGRIAAKAVVTLFSAYFLYRHGESLLQQIRLIAVSLIGERAHDYLSAIGGTVRAVVYGLILTALAQGFLAGLGYWVAGVAAPVILAIVTALVALIPFGTPFVWGSVSVWLLVEGHTWSGIGLFLWGALVVSWVDNLIRPLVISSATKISFLLVMFGVLGGLGAFGLVGLFIGPVILAILIAVWREWLEGIQERNAVIGREL